MSKSSVKKEKSSAVFVAVNHNNNNNNNNNNNDDDDDNDDAGDSFESLSEEVFSHSPKKFKAAGTPLTKESVVEIPKVRAHRLKEGILPDDGSGRRADNEVDYSAGIMELYGREWLNEAVAREMMLSEDPNYVFAKAVSGGSNLTLATLIKETEIARETKARISEAVKALVERRKQQQDSRGEQDRAKALRDDIAKLEANRLRLDNLYFSIRKSQLCITEKLAAISAFNLKFTKVIATDFSKWYERQFDLATRALVAKYTSGPRAFELSLATFKTLVQVLNSASITANVGDANIRTRINADMPNSSTLAFSWTTLLAIYLNSHLLERVAEEAVHHPSSFYARNKIQYADDLRSLATLVFITNGAPATDNLLLLDKITIFLWKMLNDMIKRSAPDDASAATSILAKPTKTAENRGTSRPQNIVVNDIEVTIDISDEDLSAAVAGHEVIGVDRDNLAAMQRNLYKNLDQPRVSVLIIKLLEPMLNSVWKHLFYTKFPLEEGLDEEAFAGGYYGEGRVVELFGLLSGVKTAEQSVSGLVVVAEFMFEKCLDAGTVQINQMAVSDSSNALQQNQQKQTNIEKSFNGIFITSADTQKAYERNLVARYVIREGLLLCLAEAIVAKNKFRTKIGITDSEAAVLSAYVDACQAGGVPGSRKDPKFFATEEAARRVFETANLTLTENDIALNNNGSQQTVAIPADLNFSNSQKRFVDAAMAFSKIKTAFEVEWQEIDDLFVSLKEQEAAIRKRTHEQISKKEDDEKSALAAIIRDGYSDGVTNKLTPANTGFLFYTELYWSTLNFAYAKLREFVPCVAKVYSKEALIESETYQTEYAAVCNAMLRKIDTRNPHTYNADKREARAKTQFASELESVRSVARADRAVKHWPGCGCSESASVFSSAQFNASAPYPLAPSLQISRGAF
jgi:hypothetical protein